MAVSIKALIQDSLSCLIPVSENPRLEVEILLSTVLAVNRSYLYSYPEKKLSTHQVNLFEKILERRKIGEPIAYILGKKAFWSFELDVSPATLIPRPETELLVEMTLRYVSDRLKFEDSTVSVADLGTGSGAIAIALAIEKPNWEIVATDISVDALAVARSNAKKLHCSRIQFYQGDWLSALPKKKYTALVSNPPYIAIHDSDVEPFVAQFEPWEALFSGNGLDAISLIIQGASPYLKTGGCLILEHGARQAGEVVELFKRNQYTQTCTYPDLSGKSRVTVGLMES